MKPELKQFGDLTQADFERHPVWIAVHTVDNDEEWYDETNEETFRPWDGALPVDPSEGMLLVRSSMRLADGSTHLGFVTPAFTEADLGTQQPQILTSEGPFGFWGGMFGIPPESRQQFYQLLGKGPQDVFPVSFAADPGLANGAVSGEAEGFYRMTDDDIQVER